MFASLVRSPKLVVVAATIVMSAALGLAAGAVTGVVQPPIAVAACGSTNGLVCGFPGYKESAIEVSHVRYEADLPYYIEPNTGEDWEAVVWWSSDMTELGCQCQETSHTVTFTVDWNATSKTFVAVCTSGCSAFGPVTTVNVCAIQGCDLLSNDPHGWRYRVRMSVAQTRPICSTRVAYLNRVVYTTTDVDDGRGIVYDCDLGSTYTPTSQTFSVTDTGASHATGTFPCYPSCDFATPIEITYQ